MASKQTTGATISRLGVLTCLTQNLLSENHLDAETRERYERERDAILAGERGVPAQKVEIRSLERCIMGGGNGGFLGWN